MMACSVAPSGRCSSAISVAVLVLPPPAGRARRVALLLVVAFFGATRRRCTPALGCRCWMAFQIRAAATCRLVNRSTGSTPGRLFQISTSLDPGHLPASALSSCGLLKVSVPSSGISVSCEEAKTVMLLSTSIVNVIKFLSSGYSSSMTFITLVDHTCKEIVRLFAPANQQRRLYGRRSAWRPLDLTVLLHRAMDVLECTEHAIGDEVS